MFHWLADNWPGIAVACFIISEILPLIKTIKANGILDGLIQFFKALASRT